MRLTHLWAIMLIVFLSNCNQASRNKSITGLSSTTTASPIDAAFRVSYLPGQLKSDTTLFTQPRNRGTLTDESIVEASGLAPSQKNSGCLWTEEDSGNPSQIQLLNQDGTVVARFILDGLENNDWEDIAIGPGPVPGQSYIYLAEIGDNQFQYAQKIIYRFPEPDISNQKLPVEGHISAIDVIRLQLPEGPQNAEAILVDPTTKDLFILSKDDFTTVYRATFPQSTTKVTLMTPLLVLPFEKVTSGAVSADGSEILIRTYERLFYYTRGQGESITDALKREPKLVPMAYEPQGEAVGWAADGSGYYTTSEKTHSTMQVLYFYQRKK